MTTENVTRFFAPPEAATYLGVTPRTMLEWRRTGRGPRYVRLGGPSGRVRYDVEELDRFMTAATFEHTAAERAAGSDVGR